MEHNYANIIEYLSNSDLYIKSKDSGISKDDLYQISKKIAFTDENFSKYLLKFLDKKHKLGYEAFIYAVKDDEKEISDIINFIEIDYEITECHEEYVECIFEIAISIVDTFPYKSLNILNNINETYSIVGSVPSKTLDLSVNIVCSIAKKDMKKSLEYLDIIGVDYFKLEALEKLVLISQSKEIIDTINKMIEDLKTNINVSKRG